MNNEIINAERDIKFHVTTLSSIINDRALGFSKLSREQYKAICDWHRKECEEVTAQVEGYLDKLNPKK